MPRKIRQIRIQGNTAFITLTKGHVAVIDASFSPYVDQWNWTAMDGKGGVYAFRKVNKKNIFLHRVVAGDPVGLEVDHIDGDTLNNRKQNLRAATKSQNSQNVSKHFDGKAKYKGVSWGKSNSKWQAQIKANGVRHHLGYFLTQEDAKAAYDAASARLHGDFGKVSP